MIDGTMRSDEGLPRVSIVVCTYNGGERIKDCLEALLNQTYPKERLEIVVVDDGSTDNTREVLSGYGSVERVKVVSHEENLGLGSARNTGIRSSIGDVVAFTDDDCVASEVWVEELVRLLRSGVHGVGGKVEAYEKEGVLEKYVSYSRHFWFGVPPVRRGTGIRNVYSYLKSLLIFERVEPRDGEEVSGVWGMNSAYRRDALTRVGGCDSSLRRGVDSDLNQRLKMGLGARFVYSSKAVVYHRHRSTPSGFVRHVFEYGFATPKKIFSQRRLFLPYPFTTVSVFLLLLLAFVAPSLVWLSALPVVLFVVLELLYSVKVAFRTRDYSMILLIPLLEIVREFIFNLGYVSGLIIQTQRQLVGVEG